jgi:hypothetical protein
LWIELLFRVSSVHSHIYNLKTPILFDDFASPNGGKRSPPKWLPKTKAFLPLTLDINFAEV